ncbi:SDR family oxidoreductase [Vallicoccus soli]|uniref:SDR family NAD(P)-dependent oxidoreductase n=1 Tax=Vallicoccus soli TaxID=2339232 RepID=A0A3A3YZ74_9ACTN|nr:SDR family NAD(P)-dependent oxidoreductase [Vallicoccus soli]
MVLSGGSRGIGLAIAVRWARGGGDVVLLAKTAAPHPRLEGTLATAAAAVEEAGGRALPVTGDVRSDEDVARAVAAAVQRFGGVDVVVNNASAIDLSGVRDLPMKRYDLLQDVDARGTYLLTATCVPHLEESARAGRRPHVLTLSPPIDLDPRWFDPMTAYAMAKYGMSMCTIGFARQLAGAGVAVDSLWPRTTIATAAVANLLGGEAALRRSRTPEVVADAAWELLTRPGWSTGGFHVDEDVLRAAGTSDLSRYLAPGAREEDLATDFFLPGGEVPPRTP